MMTYFNSNIIKTSLLISALILSSLADVLGKVASKYDFKSVQFYIYLFLDLVSIGVFAVLWQMILKRMPLSQSYLFKSLTIVFTLFLAWLIFDETIYFNNIIGSGLIIIGVLVNSYRFVS